MFVLSDHSGTVLQHAEELTDLDFTGDDTFTVHIVAEDDIEAAIESAREAIIWTASVYTADDDEDSGPTGQGEISAWQGPNGVRDAFTADDDDRLIERVRNFVAHNASDVLLYLDSETVRVNSATHSSSPAVQLGHDYVLTAQHQGAGFWDRGLGELGDRLTTAAHADGNISAEYREEDDDQTHLDLIEI